MKKPALALIGILLLHWSCGQDYRILQADKGKVFVSATRSQDNILQIVIINADWRLDYEQKSEPCHPAMLASADSSDLSAVIYKQKTPHISSSSDEHHSREKMAHSFYMDVSTNTNVNEIFRKLNVEYGSLMHREDYQLVKHFLPDTTAEYTVHGYKGNNSAALEVQYLWGGPLREWSVGFSLSIHDREARKVLSSLLCMSPSDTELPARKIKIRQVNLLAIMTYAEMFCE